MVERHPALAVAVDLHIGGVQIDSHLLTQRRRTLGGLQLQCCRVHPRFVFQRGVSPPLALSGRTRFRDRFLPDRPLVWVEDTVTGVLAPFWADRGDIGVLSGLRAGRRPPADLPEALTDRLTRAGALTTAAELAAQGRRGAARCAQARDELARDRHTRLAAVLHPGQLTALADYYGRLVASGRWDLGDPQVDRRHGWHNERMARFLHHQLTGYVGRIAGEPVRPAYAYSSAYRGGAALPAHTDREQCEYTLSLLLDQSAESAAWPLWFLGPRGRASVELETGEAVLFRGCELPHWRESAPPERWQTMLLFHFVPATFSGVLD